MFIRPQKYKLTATSLTKFTMTNILYTVSQKNSQNCFSHNFVKCLLTFIIFGTKMAKTIELC